MDTESRLFKTQARLFVKSIGTISARCCAEIDAATFGMSKDRVAIWASEFLKAKVRERFLYGIESSDI